MRTLRELHQRHHDPALMRQFNFNVTIPVFDVLCGTYLKAGTRPPPADDVTMPSPK